MLPASTVRGTAQQGTGAAPTKHISGFLRPRRAAFVLALISIVATTQVSAMGKNLYLFSEVQGTVTQGGKPVVGAEVQRTHVWKDKPRTERVTTGATGRFAFPAVIESSFLASMLPHEPVVPQKIFIHVGGNEYEAWMHTKHNYNDLGELNGKPIRLECDLESEAGFRDGFYGICTLSED